MLTPIISVIVPIYGTEKYLDKCLRSVREQTLKDIEIICVDDCSPDNSYKIVEKHKKQDNRIKLIRHKKNLGLGGARNTAIRAAKAEYIASVDSDDYISPNMLEILWEATDGGWFDIVCCGFNSVDIDGNILSQHEYPKRQYCNDDNSVNIFTALNPAFWNKLWRTSLFTDNAITFPNKDFYEDMSTTPQVLAKSRYIKVIQDRLYQYLIRPESISTSYSDKHIIDYFRGFELIFDFLDKNKLYQHYQKEFQNYVKSHVLLHSKNILSSNMFAEKKLEYLRHLLLFRDAYIENFDLIRKKDLGGIVNLFKLGDVSITYKTKYDNAITKVAELDESIKKLRKDVEKNQLKLLLKEKENEAYKNKVAKLDESIKKLLTDVENSQLKLRMQEKENAAYKNKVHEVTSKKELYRGHVRALAHEEKSNKEKIHKISLERDIYRKEIELIRRQVDNSLSLYSKIGVALFSIITKFTLTQRQSIKLKNTPRQFFKDSNNKAAQIFALLFKIV